MGACQDERGPTSGASGETRSETAKAATARAAKLVEDGNDPAVDRRLVDQAIAGL